LAAKWGLPSTVWVLVTYSNKQNLIKQPCFKAWNMITYPFIPNRMGSGKEKPIPKKQLAFWKKLQKATHLVSMLENPTGRRNNFCRRSALHPYTKFSNQKLKENAASFKSMTFTPSAVKKSLSRTTLATVNSRPGRDRTGRASC